MADMPSYELYQVDAFTSRPFRGNPAAVVLLDAWPDDAWMQHVATENNLSETAFLVPGTEAWGLRWFTPAVEVDLCGHATVASTHVLLETERLRAGATAAFDTRSGRLTATPIGDGWIELDFPALPAAPAEAPPGLLEGLGSPPPTFIGRSRFDYLVEVESATDVEKIVPDHRALREVDTRGVCVTAAGDGDLDFVSRFFGPGAGVDEDPVTGSAHCILTPYWAAKTGKERLVARQVSARGGDLRLHSRGERVGIAGQAVTVIRGVLVV
jgi:predicted PhzF superfamily epimerase YddE/YHI9